MAEFYEDGKSVRMGHDKCPSCNYGIDASGAADNSSTVPNPGDLTVCLNCGDILVFGSDMALEKADNSMIEETDIKAKAQLLGTRKAIAKMKDGRKYLIGDFTKNPPERYIR